MTVIPEHPVRPWRRYRQTRELLVMCGRCTVATQRPAAEGWRYRRFADPLYTEARCARCYGVTNGSDAA